MKKSFQSIVKVEFAYNNFEADSDNQTILYNAFEHLFFKYARFKDD